MRVLCLNPYLPPPMGGIEKEMLAIAAELSGLGHAVKLLATTARFPRGENGPPTGVPAGVEVERLPGYLRSTLRGFAPARAPVVIPGLAAAARAAEPDLVLVFNVGWGPPLRPVLARLQGGAPVLYRTYFHPPGGILRGVKTRYILRTVAGADRAFVATRGEKEALAAQGVLDPARIAVVPPGVSRHPPPDAERIAALRREHRLEGKVAIAHVGRLGRFKGTVDLIEALPEVRQRSGQDVVAVLIGQREEPLPGSEHVRYTGEIADDRTLRALLGACQLFALPSCYEAFGIVYIEALAEGLPCVGCDVGGVGEAIGEDGVMIPRFGDRAALVEALVRLVADEPLRVTLGERGRKRVLGSLTWRHTALGLLALADQVRSGRRERAT